MPAPTTTTEALVPLDGYEVALKRHHIGETDTVELEDDPVTSAPVQGGEPG